MIKYFEVSATTHFGDTVAVVGSIPQFGEWSTERACKLETDETSYPVWRLAQPIQVPTDKEVVEYKLIILRGDGSVDWEPLDRNRTLKGLRDARIVTAWGQAAAQIKERHRKHSKENVDAPERVVAPTQSRSSRRAAL